MEEFITLTIDNQKVKVKKGFTILEAARLAGIDIPTLCFLKDVHQTGDCRMCIVEVEGRRGFTTSCITKAEEGMVVHTNTPEIREARKVIMDLTISNHHVECLTCVRSGNCELQQVAKKMNIDIIEFEGEKKDYARFLLAKKYKVCERTVFRIVKRLSCYVK